MKEDYVNIINEEKEMKEESKYRRPDGFQSIEDKIRLVASEMKCVQYIFENWQTANVKLDSTALPAMLNVLPASGVMKFGQQQIKDYPNSLFASWTRLIWISMVKKQMSWWNDARHTRKNL